MAASPDNAAAGGMCNARCNEGWEECSKYPPRILVLLQAQLVGDALGSVGRVSQGLVEDLLLDVFGNPVRISSGTL